MGIKLFNNLPVQIKQLDNCKGFKREVKTCLLINSFCMIAEFFALCGNTVFHTKWFNIITNCTCSPILL